jgi:hypothetical protein
VYIANPLGSGQTNLRNGPSDPENCFRPARLSRCPRYRPGQQQRLIKAPLTMPISIQGHRCDQLKFRLPAFNHPD